MAIIAAMVAIFALVVLFREPIRIHWWGHRLAHATNPVSRSYYVQLLASRGQRSLSVASRLLHNASVPVREDAIAIASLVEGLQATRLLADAAGDPDAGVRRSAILALAKRRNDAVVDRLQQLADYPDISTAMLSVSVLTTVGTEQALDVLIHLAHESPRPGVRAQAIESLGQWGPDQRVRDALRACLDDNALVDFPIETERQARAALGILQRHLAESGEQVAADTQTFAPMTNAQRAARALRHLDVPAPLP
jgi:HEAT repeat protein